MERIYLGLFEDEKEVSPLVDEHVPLRDLGACDVGPGVCMLVRVLQQCPR
jgi:hypothetical protein